MAKALAKKEIKVPKLSELQIEYVLDGLRSDDPEDRAMALAEVFTALMPNTPPEKFSMSVKDAKTWTRANGFIYEAIGGMFRHAMWADQNPGEFYSQMGKTFQAVANINVGDGGNISISTGVPDSKLNDPAPVRAIDAEFREVEDDDF